jgi:hypothetical protein
MRRTPTWRIVLTLLPLVLLAIVPALALAADPVTPVAQGTDLYNQGKFKEAVDLLKAAFDKGEVKPVDLGTARELMARSMVKADMRGPAREAFVAILRKDAAYRPDPNKVPPDEVAVFNEALRDFQSEQLEQGRRIPASVGGFFGYGMYKPKQINDAIVKYTADLETGGQEEIKGGSDFGGSVRFPVRSGLSLDLEIVRLRASVSDSGSVSQHVEPQDYEISAIPIVANLYYTAFSRPRLRANLFAGAGPMFTQFRYGFSFFPGIPFTLSGNKTGFCGQLGAEAEYLVTPRIAVSGRVLGRMASASKVYSFKWPDPTDDDQLFSRFDGKNVSFSGLAFNIGLRAYIGY